MTTRIDSIEAEIAAENALWDQMRTEFPGWPLGDLKDVAGSVSPRMSAEARAVQTRYHELAR